MPHSVRSDASDENSALEPIAICGMACRLPGGVDSAASFWNMLVQCRDGQSARVPESRFNIDAYFHENLERPGSFNVMGGYFLDGDPSDFDPTAFGITPIEASWLDPQQRKMIEVVYECFESAGVPLEQVAGSNTAVFVGCFTADYQQMSIRDPDFRHNYAATGVDPGIISNRIGNLFNLNGPSFTINTACSSSVYALHNACHALRARDCDAAIVGGVNLIVTVDQHMNTAKLGILSPTSFCHTFDASADGYGRAEGAGALYIKRLSDAIRDRDIVRSIIRSTAVNTNGKVEGMGITHPSKRGQERVVRAAYERANLDPNKTAYAELHGTGTPVGDPIEVEAVSRALNDSRSRTRPLLIGAVKPNIGHSEAASGVFAVMKAAMMTETAVIPGVARLQNINPAIHEQEWNVKVNAKLTKWPEGFATRRASVSSFGYGGTNGHVIVESVGFLHPSYKHGARVESADYDHTSSRPRLICFSGHDKITLRRNIEALRNVGDEYFLADLAHTLNTRRTHHLQRCFTVAGDRSFNDACTEASLKFGTAPKESTEVGFIFTGQGAQYESMGKTALASYPCMAQTVRRLNRILQRLPFLHSVDLETLISGEQTATRINEPDFAQAATTALQIALVDLLAGWGIEPSVTLGHSSGEIGAAYAAGMISAPEAILVAFCRGQAVHSSSVSGTMLSVGLPIDEIGPYLKGHADQVFVACENSHNNVTLSGAHHDIRVVQERLETAGIFHRELTTGRAYHSPYMHAVGDVYEQLLTSARHNLVPEDYEWRRPLITMISSVTGKVIDDPDQVADPAYWIANLRNRVLFKSALSELGHSSELQNVKALIEIGPRPALSGPFKQICAAEKLSHLSYVPSLVRNNDDTIQLLSVAGALFLNRYPLNLEAVNEEPSTFNNHGHAMKVMVPLPLVDLPPYQWNYGKKYWAEARASQEVRSLREPRHDLLGRLVAGLSSRSGIWRNILRHRDLPWLKDHSLGGSTIFPAAGHMSLAIEALRQMSAARDLVVRGVILRDTEIRTALTITHDDAGVEIQVTLSAKPSIGQEWYEFTIESLQNGSWTLNSSGTISASIGVEDIQTLASGPVVRDHLTHTTPSKRWYEALKGVGFDYGPHFQKLGTVRSDPKFQHAAADVTIVKGVEGFPGESDYIIHPSTVDACLQLVIISINRGQHKTIPYGVVPVKFDEICLWMPQMEDLQAHGSAIAWTSDNKGRMFHTHTRLFGASGSLVMSIQNLRCVSYEAALPPSIDDASYPQPYSETIWKPDCGSITTKDVMTIWPCAFSPTETVARIVELVNHKSPLQCIRLLGRPERSLILTLASIVSRRCKVEVGSPLARDTDRIQDLFDTHHDIRAFNINSATDGITPGEPEGNLLMIDLSADDEIDLSAVSSCFEWALQIQDSKDMQNRESLIPGMTIVMEISLPVVYYGRSERSVVVLRRSPEPSPVGWESPSFALVRATSKNTAQQDSLCQAMQALGAEVSSSRLGKATPDLAGTILFDSRAGINLASIEDEQQFDDLKTLVTSGKKIIWLTQGVYQGNAPHAGMAIGFLRVIRNEQAVSQILMLDHDDTESADNIAYAVLTVAEAFSTSEREFWLHDGLLHIPRIRPNHDLNRYTAQGAGSFHGAIPREVPVQLTVSEAGLAYTPLLSPMSSQLEPTAVRIQVEAVQRVLRHGEPSMSAGTILASGADMPKSLLGKKVVALHDAERRSVIDSLAFVVLDPLSRLESVVDRLPALASAVYAALFVGRVQPSDHVVLSRLSPALQDAFVGLSKALKWQYRVIVSSAEEKLALCTRLGLPPETVLLDPAAEVFHSTTRDAKSQTYLIASTFDATSNEMWRLIPRLGRFVLCGPDTSAKPDAAPFERGASFLIANFQELLHAPASTIQDVLGVALNLYRAHAYLHNPSMREVGGSAADRPPASNVIKINYAAKDVVKSPTKSAKLPDFASNSLALDGEAAYFLVGCLGGLGRSLTRLMADRGAKHFAFLSRSGIDKPEAARVVSALEERGCTVDIFRGDAANAEDIQRALHHIERSRKVKGVVQAAMVLKDGIIANMTLADYAACVSPKAKGSQALHDAFMTRDLDFFVMTSSISATLGNPGQANYSAANSFQDFLALQRRRRGQAATSLILPMVLDVGVVSESDGLEAALLRKGMYGIDEQDMLKAFEVAMLHSRPQQHLQVTSPGAVQLILGLESKHLAQALASTDTSNAYWYNDTRLQHIRHDVEASVGTAGTKFNQGGFEDELKAAAIEGRDAVILAIAKHIAQKCSSILMLADEDLDLNGPSIASYGLDSMIGAEMRNWLYKALHVDVPFQTLLAPTLSFNALAEHVAISRGLISGPEDA